jgi:hypothetical protein
VPLPVWIALIALLSSLTAGAAFVFLRLRRLWRTFKSFGSALDGTVRELTGSIDRLGSRTDALGSSELEPSLKRLRRSLAQAAVLSSALQEARESLARVTAVYPRK